MRAWAVVENGKPLQELELPTPEPKGTEVLVEVTHCGVCHSDLHIWEGYYDIGGGRKMSLKDRGVVLPLAMGHEIVGRVAKLGSDATGVKVNYVRSSDSIILSRIAIDVVNCVRSALLASAIPAITWLSSAWSI